jgi:phage-related protein
MGRLGNVFRKIGRGIKRGAEWVGGKVKRGAQWVSDKIKEHPWLTAAAITAAGLIGKKMYNNGQPKITSKEELIRGVEIARTHVEDPEETARIIAEMDRQRAIRDREYADMADRRKAYFES